MKKVKIILVSPLILVLILLMIKTIKIFYSHVKYDEYYLGNEYEYLAFNEEIYIRCDANDNFYSSLEGSEPIGFFKADLITMLLADCRVYCVYNSNADNYLLYIPTVIDNGFYYLKRGVDFEDIFKSINISMPDNLWGIYIYQDENSIKDKTIASEFYNEVKALQNPIKIAVDDLYLIRKFKIGFEDCYVDQKVELKADKNSNYYLLTYNPLNELDAVYLLENETVKYFLEF